MLSHLGVISRRETRMDATLNDRTTTYSPAEAAERIGLQESTLRNMRSRGGGPPFVRVGGRVRYRALDLARWLETRVRECTRDAGGGP